MYKGSSSEPTSACPNSLTVRQKPAKAFAYRDDELMVASEPIKEYASTKTLVELFQKGGGSTDWNLAFRFLVHRFRTDVLRVCEIRCKKFGHNVTTAEVIASMTFDSYARKGRFDEAKGKGKTYDESFLLYLLGIAEHELINYYRERERQLKSPYDGTEQLYFELPDNLQGMEMTDEMWVELSVVRDLSAKHRAIYLTYKVHQRQGFKMPRPLLAALRKALDGITQDTVNVYLKEARDEVKNATRIYHLTNKMNGNGKGQ